MDITHIIFDLDGTLVNTIEDIALAMNRALTAYGFTALPLQTYPDLVGWGIHRLAELALASQGVSTAGSDGAALVNRIAQEALARYDEVPLRYSKPYPGVPELLHRLHVDGLVLAVLTNKPDPVAHQVVEGLFPGIEFALIRGDRSGAPKKPDPALSRLVMNAIGAPIPGTLFVGDSVVDVQTAHNVGCPVVGVSWGFRGPTELVAAGADYIIQNPAELYTVLY
ncbi:HAD family hydrolase [Gracilinema caldarium]|uniref:phosphoglycolate phosphatase n=1 Tax=Gracilinema caldarium (strain ATCC 51460 / DSM 7334 / H1) TaxID=744872 RepID=F8EXB2_GRAC1|nr:HAD family hydrolase [Gracilinema caldarium]AEJ18855.1 HAD-superfamily hydrolase, subfamily IA, variant 1 [Gracilinema caldarium DSM 7334]